MNKVLPLLAFSVLLLLPVGSQNSYSHSSGHHVSIEIVSMNMIFPNPIPIPLASDPLNALGDNIGGYAYVDSDYSLSLSSVSPSSGEIKLIPGPGVDIHNIQNGDQFTVDSFFDVFFDVTVTDVDTRTDRDYAGQPDGATIVLSNIGPWHMDISYLCTADITKSLAGCLEQLQGQVGVFPNDIDILLGADLDGNAIDEKIRWEPGQMSFGSSTVLGLTPEGELTIQFGPGTTIDFVASMMNEPDNPPGPSGADFNISGNGLVGVLVPAPGALPPLPPFPDDSLIGGEIIPIEATSLILAGAQTPAVWMLSALSALGIGAFWITRNPYNVRNIKVLLEDYFDRIK